MLSDSEFEHLRNLSKLELSEGEINKFKADFNDVIAFASQVSKAQVDLTKSYFSSIKMEDLREDMPKPSLKQEEVIKNAPNKKNGCFVVPRIME